jgi:RNA polymerase sigma-70 factor (ECF subfamily)
LAGDERAFARLVERYRAQLQLHCDRMLGSLQDAEDLVQETLLRAWRRLPTFQGGSTFRTWLYRIATNACLDFLDRRQRRPRQAPQPGRPAAGAAEVPWLQPYPDRLLEQAAAEAAEPEAMAISRETIELAFLVAIQHLPARQRAVLILRDVLGWPADEAATTLEVSVAAVKSALQRPGRRCGSTSPGGGRSGRPTPRPPSRSGRCWSATSPPTSGGIRPRWRRCWPRTPA